MLDLLGIDLPHHFQQPQKHVPAIGKVPCLISGFGGAHGFDVQDDAAVVAGQFYFVA